MTHGLKILRGSLVQFIWYEAFKMPGELDTNNDDYLLHGDEKKDLFSRQFC